MRRCRRREPASDDSRPARRPDAAALAARRTASCRPAGSDAAAAVRPRGAADGPSPAAPTAPARRPRPPAAPPPQRPPSPLRNRRPRPPPPAARGGDTFLWPVKGRIVEGYGAGPEGTRNDGINIAAPRGAAVEAADAGVVAYAGNELRGYGNLLLIKHPGGWISAYAHCDVILVKPGQKVARGQVVARVGASGNVATPQLHFELRRGNKPVDPRAYLSPLPSAAAPPAHSG